MEKPIITETFSDNGEHSHWELLDKDGKVLWDSWDARWDQKKAIEEYESQLKKKHEELDGLIEKYKVKVASRPIPLTDEMIKKKAAGFSIGGPEYCVMATAKWVREYYTGEKTEQKTVPFEYEYEMFFKSEPTDNIKIDGWMPISTDRIKHPERIDEYIERGILRKHTI